MFENAINIMEYAPREEVKLEQILKKKTIRRKLTAKDDFVDDEAF